MQRIFKDQLNRTIEIDYPPRRIISLVPSQTELLFDLGLDTEVAGITKFCVHPKDKFKQKPKIGGTKQLNIAAIRALKPDLIIGNKEENERGQIEQLMQEFPVWMSDINNLHDALDMVKQIGELCEKQSEAGIIAESIHTGFTKLSSSRMSHDENSATALRAAYLIWKNPYMVAGTDTFINEMIRLAGWENAIPATRYPEVTEEELKAAAPDVILLSSEPYPFTGKHIEEFKRICPQSSVEIVDGELFCWYGSRLQRTPDYLYSLNQQFNTIKSQ